MKVAFINARPYLGGLPLVGMPFAYNTVHLLLQMGVTVDVYIGEAIGPEWNSILGHPLLRVKSFSADYFLGREFWLQRRAAALSKIKGYSAVCGVGPVGLTFAHGLARRSGAALIAFNDEFPCTYADPRWRHWLEKEAAALRAADVIVTPDKIRVEPLQCEVTGLQTKRFVELCNAPLAPAATLFYGWKETLGIPSGHKFLVAVGGVGHMHFTTELISQVCQWPENMHLVLRPFPANKGKHFLRATGLSKLPDRVHWVTAPLTEIELNSLVREACASLVFYRDVGPKLRHVGKSSGKLMRSLLLGTPVVVTKGDGFEFIENERLGWVVDDPADLLRVVRMLGEEDQTVMRKFEYCYESIWRATLLPFFESIFERQR